MFSDPDEGRQALAAGFCLLEHSLTCCLATVYSCFCAAMIELNICNGVWPISLKY